MNPKISLKSQHCDLWAIVECSTIGKRPSMEDSSAFMYPFLSDTSLFVSVFDGHAGSRCSNFLSKTIPEELLKETQLSNALLPSKEIFLDVFSNVDEKWLEAAKSPRNEDGSTALCITVDLADLVVANCGDCRAILCQGGQTVALTRDHKPTDEEERQRIVIQGGTVIGGRLQGQLGVSRAFGNYEFKETQILSAEPEFNHVTLTCEVEFLVVGCDGLYEQFSNDEIISYIKNGLVNLSLEDVVRELVEEAIDRGADDNITIIVVKFDKAFKKLLKKRAKKQSGKSQTILSGRNGLRTSGKGISSSSSSKSSTSDSPPPEPKSIFKKGLNLRTSGKSSDAIKTNANPKDTKEEPTLIPVNPEKKIFLKEKKRESKKLKSEKTSFKVPSSPRPESKSSYDEDKWNKLKQPFKHDFFGRTAVTIIG